jgi:hypothetical protein
MRIKTNSETLVKETYIQKICRTQVSAIAFEALSEIWKPAETNNNFVHFRGLCDNTPHYTFHVSF